MKVLLKCLEELDHKDQSVILTLLDGFPYENRKIFGLKKVKREPGLLLPV